jgi:copper chaperone NosL
MDERTIISKYYLLLVTILLILATGCSGAGPRKAFKIGVHKECPLCGMIPARYPEFHCQVVLKNGEYVAFDSAAGLMTYLLFPDKTGIEPGEVSEIYFKDYITETWISADQTFFVVGSEIMGPMGIEFLAVDNEENAQALKKQEKGELIIRYQQIDRQFMLKAAEQDWLHFLAHKWVTK